MKQVFEKLSCALLCGVFCLSGIDAFAAPTISGLKVTPVEPMGIAIDYNVSGATEDYADMPFFVSMTVNEKEYMASAEQLFGAKSCSNGAHRVYWNIAREGLSFESATAATLKVSYNYPRYCVINHLDWRETNPVTYMDKVPEGGFNSDSYKGGCLVLRRVDAGSFIMGENQTEESHRVTLSQPFYLGLFEVTMLQFRNVYGADSCSNYSHGDSNYHPAHCTAYNLIRGSSEGAKWPATNSVDDASFLGKLRERSGLQNLDLPTEAQWEYACRAGSKTAYSYGDTANGDYMWYQLQGNGIPGWVGSKAPNGWGFYDMHGNMWEWCLDWWSDTLSYGVDPKGATAGSYRVARGGSFGSSSGECTSFYRKDWSLPGSGYFNFSFRIACTLPLSDATPVSATTEFSLSRIIASGSNIDGKIMLGTAPTETQNAVVGVWNDKILNTRQTGSWLWTAPSTQYMNFQIYHKVGNDEINVYYHATNCYMNVKTTPNPPMSLVEGITLSPSGTVSVVAKPEENLFITISGNGEAWTGATSADWLKLNSTSGTATGKSVVCTVSENIDADGRVGYVYIAGQTLTVKQEGRGATVDAQATIGPAGGEGEVSISVADATTTWSAYTTCPWVEVVTTSGTGSGVVKFRVMPYNMMSERKGSFTVAGKNVLVIQSAARFVIEGDSTRYCDANGIKSLTVTVRVDGETEPWTVKISDNAADMWVFLMSDNVAVTGDGTFELCVKPAEEGDTLPRTATVTAGTAKLTITQKAGVIITPTDGGASLTIPDDWFATYYPNASRRERKKIVEGAGVKTSPVWQDYVAGTDPTNAASKFTAKIEMKDGAPSITWDPALNGEGVRKGNSRLYRVWGKSNLNDASWSEVSSGSESDYNFFRVTVEMP